MINYEGEITGERLQIADFNRTLGGRRFALSPRQIVEEDFKSDEFSLNIHRIKGGRMKLAKFCQSDFGSKAHDSGAAEKSLISNVSIFDVFESEVLGDNKKSLGVEVTLQPREKTLTDEEIEVVAARIVAAVNKATGG